MRAAAHKRRTRGSHETALTERVPLNSTCRYTAKRCRTMSIKISTDSNSVYRSAIAPLRAQGA